MIRKYFLESLLINIYLILSIFLIIGITITQKLNILLIVLIGIILLICLIGIIFTYLNKNIKIYNIGVFITLLSNIILLYNINELNNRYSYIENLYKKEYMYEIYNIYVKKSTTKYDDISSLKGKNIGMLKENSQNIKEYFNDIEDMTYVYYNSLGDLLIAIDEGSIQAFIINEQKFNNFEKENNIKNKVRIIFSNKIKYNI